MNSDVVFVYVREGQRDGYVLAEGIYEIVDFPRKRQPPSPGAILRCKVEQRPNRRQVMEWNEQREYVVASDVRVAPNHTDGPIGRIDHNLLPSEPNNGVLRIDTGEGPIVAVHTTRQRELVTHYAFDGTDPERKWIIERVSRGEPVKSYEGTPIRFSDELNRQVGWEIDSSSTYESVRTERRAELDRIQRDRREGTAGLALLQAEKADVERKLEAMKAALQEARDEERQLIDKTAALDRTRKAYEAGIRELEADQRQQREQLARNIDRLRQEHSELLVHVDHLRTQVQSRVVLDETVSLERARRLAALAPIEDEAEAIASLVESLRGRAEATTLVGLHVSLKHCPFVVLTGPSGSGKSSLLTLYARVLGMASEVVAVQPNWTSSADLHGYVAPLGTVRHFVSTPFADVLGLQFATGEQLHDADIGAPFVSLAILDEINLAHVEYYLADYLSALESEAREVVVSSPLELAEALVPLWLRHLRGRVPLPPSLLLAGTANEDHTTQGFSDKFRDRAGVIEVRPTSSNVGSATAVEALLPNALGRVTPSTWRSWKALPEATTSLRASMTVANKVLSVLRSDGFHVGHRIVRDVEVLMRAAHPLLKPHLPKMKDKDAANAALDIALSSRVVQKYVPAIEKRTGWTREERRKALARLLGAVPKECTQTRQQLEDAQA